MTFAFGLASLCSLHDTAERAAVPVQDVRESRRDHPRRRKGGKTDGMLAGNTATVREALREYRDDVRDAQREYVRNERRMTSRMVPWPRKCIRTHETNSTRHGNRPTCRITTVMATFTAVLSSLMELTPGSRVRSNAAFYFSTYLVQSLPMMKLKISTAKRF